MRLKKICLLIMASLSVLLLGLQMTQAAVKAASDPTPTVFVHGLQGSHGSTDRMINDLSRRYQAKKVLTINVQNDGSLQVQGHYRAVKRPLVQVNFINNSASTTTNARWLTTALLYLHRQGVKNINLVAHSAGNVAVYQALCNQPKQIPQVKKWVDMAGPFDGVITLNDSPNKTKVAKDDHYRPSIMMPANSYYPSFQELKQMSSKFPKSVKILNLYGDVQDGTHSDTLVSNASALSINYLLPNQVTPIKNRCWHNPAATHTGLHKSRHIDNWLAAFLW